ncbi:hypothetical protein J2X31_000760 [Flavobacterium arsenatis]|uniref:HYDIN/VesB/CFA65-like Ig-like domain-containing protein n=1 Tax=Flavobacterium arsenatis TaxID=1484332 RepID=A0ABU1TLR2_9FLAO|nr:choice-of-anchor D domain-containing protein [Flavobacterium arsenatis]MDR6966762.1 hypothetical protein [Flavobacterium arsenatis]
MKKGLGLGFVATGNEIFNVLKSSGNRFYLAIVLMMMSGDGFAQLNIGTAGTATTQNFNDLRQSGTSTAVTGGALNNVNTSLNGWFFLEAGSNANTTYTGGNGSGNTGDTYSFGPASNTDRALGMLQSGSLTSIIGFKFTNTTGVTVTSISITYTGEVWRTSASADNLAFSYQSGNQALNAASGWTTVSQLAFTTPVTGTATNIDGNANANRTTITHTITGLSIANNASFTMRWVDASASSSAGMGIDDFSIVLNPVTSSSNVTAGAGTEPATISSLTTALTGATAPQQNAVVNFDFTVTDDSSGNDALPTLISQIVIAQGTGNDIGNWTQAIAGAQLSDGVNTSTGTVAATSITFTTNTANLGNIADGGTKTFYLRIWLNTTLGGTLPITIDGLNLAFKIDRSNFTTASSATSTQFESGAGTAVESGSTNNAVTVVATALNFVTQPSNVVQSATMSPSVTISANDANGNRDLGYVSSVSLTSTGTMTGTPLSATPVSGLATFSSIVHTVTQTSRTLAGTSGGLTATGNSNTFNVTAPPAPAISFGTFTTTALTYPLGAGPSASKNATVSGTNLTGNITVTTDDTLIWEVSTDNATWATSVSYTPSGGTVAAGSNRIYVRLRAGLAVNTYSGTLTATSTGATNQTNSLTGEVFQPTTVLTGTPTLFTYAEGQGPSAYQTLNVSGTNLAENITVTVPSINWEISTNTAFTAPVSPNTSSSIILNKNASNAVTSIPIYVRLKAGLVEGFYEIPTDTDFQVTSTNTTTKTADLDGQVTGPVPFINVEGNLGAFPDITPVTNNPTGTDNTLFAQQTVGNSQVKSYRIQNLGGSTLSISSVTIEGTNPSDFTVSTPPPTTIAAGATVTFEVTFSPTTHGVRNAIVRIANNSNNVSPNFDFNIRGTGNNPEISVTGNGNDVPNGNTAISAADNTLIGSANANAANATTVSKTFVISNTGNVTLTVSSISLSGADASQFSVSPTVASIASGNTANFTVVFAPTSYGAKNAVISIANNDATDNENPYTFAVQGNALNYVACAQDEIILYQTGFEESAFTAQTDYQQTVFDGPAGQQWKTYYGTPTTTNPSISGSKWIQMRLYNNGNIGYTQTEFDLSNVTKVDFRAKTANAELDLMVSYSIDGGTTFNNPQIYDVTNNPTDFSNPPVLTYSVSPTGEHPNVRIRFTVSGTPPSSGSKTISLDDIIIYGGSNNTKTWNGTAWSGDGLPPTSSQRAIIDGDLTLPYTLGATTYTTLEGCECEVLSGNNLTVGNPDGSVPGVLNIQGVVENSGTILLNNNSSLMQHNDEAANIGNVIIKRNTQPMYRYDFTYWSSPLLANDDPSDDATEDAFTLKELSPFTLFDKYYKWNHAAATQAWQIIPVGAEVMVPGRGYIVRAPQTYGTDPADPNSYEIYTGNFIGKPNNGFVEHAVTGGTNKWNLLGNPYPSAINIDNFLLLNEDLLEGTIYLWTHNTQIQETGVPGIYTYGNDYATYNLSGATATAPADSGGAEPDEFLASGQAFFVKGTSNFTSGKVTFNNGMRVAGDNDQFFRPGSQEPINDWQTSGKHRVWLNLTGQNAFNQAMVGYIENATNGKDWGFDGESFGGNRVTLYSILENEKMAIQGRALPFNNQDQVPLGYKTTLTGTLKISIDHFDGLFEGQDIYLEDLLLNVVHNLKEAAYTFTTIPGTFNERFVLRYLPSEALDTPDQELVANGLFVYKSNGAIRIKSELQDLEQVTVYDLLGRNIFEKKAIGGNELEIETIVMNQQPLIVKVKLADGNVVSKKVVY